MKTLSRRRRKSPARALLAVVASAAVSFVTGAQMVGHPARVVHVLTLFAAGASSGISLLKVWQDYRGSRQPAEGAPPLDTPTAEPDADSEKQPLPEPSVAPQRR